MSRLGVDQILNDDFLGPVGNLSHNALDGAHPSVDVDIEDDVVALDLGLGALQVDAQLFEIAYLAVAYGEGFGHEVELEAHAATGEGVVGHVHALAGAVVILEQFDLDYRSLAVGDAVEHGGAGTLHAGNEVAVILAHEVEPELGILLEGVFLVTPHELHLVAPVDDDHEVAVGVVGDVVEDVVAEAVLEIELLDSGLEAARWRQEAKRVVALLAGLMASHDENHRHSGDRDTDGFFHCFKS